MKFHPKLSGLVFLPFFAILPTGSTVVISGVSVEYIDVDVCVKFMILGQTVLDIPAAHFVTNEHDRGLWYQA